MSWGEVQKRYRLSKLKDKAKSKARRMIYNLSSPETQKLLDELKKRKKLK